MSVCAGRYHGQPPGLYLCSRESTVVSVGTGDPELVCTIPSQQEQYSFGFIVLVLAMEEKKVEKGASEC